MNKTFARLKKFRSFREKELTIEKLILFVIIFFALWVAAWLIHNALAGTIWLTIDKSSEQNLLYWAIMKIVVWIIYPAFYVTKFLRPGNRK